MANQNMNSKKYDELDSLLIDWKDNRLDEQGVARVRSILREDAGAREYYLQLQVLESALYFESGNSLLDGPVAKLLLDADLRPGVEADRPFSSRSVRRFSWIPLAIAASMLVGVFTFFSFQSPTIADKQETTSQGIALLTRLVEVEWADPSLALKNNEAISPGKIEIKSGLAQLEFYCGATVVLEGPALLDIHSSTEATIQYGKLRTEVPPAARGFVIRTPDFKVVDLGTEFAISVGESGTDVQVIEGEIEIHEGAENVDDVKTLTTGQAIRKVDGEFVESKLTPNDFVGIEDLALRNNDQETLRHQRWKTHSDQLRKDPRLVAYYAFDNLGSIKRNLRSSNQPDNKDFNGAVIGADPVVGRWAAKGALEFKHPGDRVRVKIPGEFENLTFMAWVRIDSLDRWYNSLFLTDGYDRGEPHWQIMDSGRLFFSVRSSSDDEPKEIRNQKTHKPVLSSQFWDPSKSGQWFHLATVYDNDAKTVSHYINGVLDTRETIEKRLYLERLRIGKASLCNWDDPTQPEEKFVIRNLNGRLDEFAIFSTALDGDEIGEMFEVGRE